MKSIKTIESAMISSLQITNLNKEFINPNIKRGSNWLRANIPIRIMQAFLIMVMLHSVSCKKDSKSSTSELSGKYFTIENAVLVEGDFPEESQTNAPVINAVVGNTSVIQGGSNPISISTGATLKEVLVGVEDINGYYKINASKLKSTETYMVTLLFNPNLEKDNFTIRIAIIDINGNISQTHTIVVTKITVGTGKLQVSCSWDKPNDLDLHLTEPNGSIVSWRTDNSDNGGELDLDSNPGCYMDNINNENITYTGDAIVEKGNYNVRISLFSSCEITDTTRYVVTARLNGTLLTPVKGKNPYYGKVAASRSYLEGDGPRDGDTVMIFNVPSTKSYNLDNVPMLRFSYPKKANTLKKELYNSK